MTSAVAELPRLTAGVLIKQFGIRMDADPLELVLKVPSTLAAAGGRGHVLVLPSVGYKWHNMGDFSFAIDEFLTVCQWDREPAARRLVPPATGLAGQ